VIRRKKSQYLLGLALAVVLIGNASAAEPLPDRRTVRPGAAAAKPGPAPGVVELLAEIETLQTQLRELRGQLELQAHQLDQMKNRQLQQMVDVDRRLRELERRAAAGPTTDTGSGNAPTTIVTPPVGGAPQPGGGATPRAAPSASEQQQYDAAFALMKQGQYEQAAKSFREFIARNPKGALAHNAQYWVGEAVYVTRDFRAALTEFGKVASDYPQSAKVPDALLKVGYCHYELGAHAKAREVLSQVVSRYPNTAAAKSAELRLEKMAKEAR
jgi:tol-pal system protein YbgF